MGLACSISATSPPEDVVKADQAIVQRTQDQRLTAVNVVALSRDLQVLNDGFRADPENNGRFYCGFSPRGPEQAFSLPVAQYCAACFPHGAREPPRGCQRERPDYFRIIKPWLRQTFSGPHNKGAGPPRFAGQVPRYSVPIADPAFLTDSEHLPIAACHGDQFVDETPFKASE